VQQQAAPSGPTLEEQQQAVVLNNEAVGILTSEPQAAIDKLQRALKLNPQYTKARIHLGNAYHNLANQQRQGGNDFGTVVNNYRQSLNILKAAVGASHPAYLATKQDYENYLQSAGAQNQ
jgi:tetratricopeptide (TPR) repeat protein